MGMFDMFEAAIEGSIDERVKMGIQAMDERVIALEQGKVQSTFTGDVQNALTEDQREAVVRIVAEAAPGEVEDKVREIVDEGLDDAISHAMDYNGAGESAIESAVENYITYTFDAESMVQDALDNNSDIGSLQNQFADLDSRIDDLENKELNGESAEDADRFSEMQMAVNSLESQVEDLTYANGFGEDEQYQLRSLRNEVDELTNRVDNIVAVLQDISNNF